jgi:hypothetical protein
MVQKLESSNSALPYYTGTLPFSFLQIFCSNTSINL